LTLVIGDGFSSTAGRLIPAGGGGGQSRNRSRGDLEPAGVPLAGPVNAIAYIAWAAWLILAGVSILRDRD